MEQDHRQKQRIVEHISQPAVSAHLKSLEQRYGEPLFERTPRGMSLTRPGEIILEHADMVHLFTVFYEEPTLRKQFGQSYDEYIRRVPRWIPKLPDKE
ncbi:MAG: LysR family transcriptional regulator [Blastocatellia bacterium]